MNLSSFLSGKTYLTRKTQYFSASGSFVAPARGKVLLLVVAPGGSGAASSTSTQGPVVSTGGGAGEVVTDVIDVEAGATFSVLLGSPGASVSVTGTSANGNDAGNTTIVGPNSYSLTAVGGKRGLVAAATGSLAGGAGGTGGTGGTINVTRAPGGRGGNSSNTPSATSISNRRATGGGGVNMVLSSSENTTRGGDVSNSNSGGLNNTGGGGCGGTGGDLPTSPGQSTGGGYGGSAVGLLVGPNAAGVRTQASPTYLIPGLACFGLDYFGGGASNAQSAGPGGGGCSVNSAQNSGGLFGGSAGYSAVNSSEAMNFVWPPGLGAGSGGMCAVSSSQVTASAAGGQSFAVFLFLQEVV